MTLIGKRRKRRVAGAELRSPEALQSSGFTPHASRLTLHAPRFTLRLSCLTLPALLLFSAGPAPSYAASTPYQGIVERNVFGLKPPPPPPDPESLKPPPPKLTLTGIMTIFGKKQALLKAPPTPAGPAKPGQPPEQPKEHSYILAEGQREDGITVLHIDDVGKSVKLDANGTIFDLTFSTNETRTASSPGPGGIPSPTGMGGPTPAFAPARTIPRPLRIPSMGSSSATSIGGSSSSLASSSGTMGSTGYGGAPVGVNAGGGTLNFNGSSGQPQVQNAAVVQNSPLDGMTPEAQAAMLEVERERTAADVQSGKMGPIPITSYTPPGAAGTSPEDNPSPAGQGGTSTPLRNRWVRPGMPLTQ